MLITFKEFLIFTSLIASSILYAEMALANDAKKKYVIEELNPAHYYDSLFRFEGNDQSKFKEKLTNIVSKKHYFNKLLNLEMLLDSCPEEMFEGDYCLGHKDYLNADVRWEYKLSRKYLFGYVFLEKDENDEYFLEAPYCDKVYTNKMITNSHRLIREMGIPQSDVVNCEHVWPQARFAINGGREKDNDLYAKKKADLHHLRPAGNRINAIRGAYRFGEIDVESETICSGSKIGTIIGFDTGDTFFEPRDLVKGDIARSLFYFSIRYGVAITPEEEHFLRKWHKEDPVSDKERLRNQRIFNVQYNRNPFIDYPSFVDQISDF